ncbi:platelet-activating factor acetylhydrolase [Trichinella spiralis]|uniref:platelet-activating factor acetylhydrolase n=1 Tax=Trichinella spiralis TaxID=6334 RepID=UPI0001EFB916|nr:platelet-activating factor acetylhydrolase [Trichinella spiralis]
MGNSVNKTLPAPSGPYIVGALDVITEHTEQGCFFRLFYPSQIDEKSNSTTEYTPWVARSKYIDGYGDAMVPAKWMQPCCSLDGTCSDAKYPLIIFSHGLGGNRLVYSAVCTELASHGYIVAAIEHRDGSASYTYYHELSESSDENEIYKEKDLFFETYEPKADIFEYRNNQLKKRVEECIKVKNYLIAKDTLEHLTELKNLKSHIDPTRIAAALPNKLSNCTFRTLIAILHSSAGIVLDGWMFPVDKEAENEVQQPLLFVNNEKFQWKENVERMQNVISKFPNRRMMYTIKGSVHQSHADFTHLADPWLGGFFKVRGSIDPQLCHEINSKMCLHFLQKYLGLSTSESTETDILVEEFGEWRKLHNGLLFGESSSAKLTEDVSASSRLRLKRTHRGQQCGLTHLKWKHDPQSSHR